MRRSTQSNDAFRLANLTGLRRTHLVAVPRSAVGEHAIVWQTQKSGGPRVITVPIIEPLRMLLNELSDRPRAAGVETILVNSRGLAGTADGLHSSFGDERDRIGFDKHLHDCHGTYITELCEAELTDEQIVGIVGWSPTRIGDIRRIYVDQARALVAIGEAVSRRTVKQSVKQWHGVGLSR